jgi:ABC-type transporter MlaC component
MSRFLQRIQSLALAPVATGMLIALAQPGSAAEPVQEALKRTEDLVAAFQAVKVPPEGGKLGAADKKANEAAFARLDGFFDFDAFVDGAIETSKAKLSKAQLGRYRKLFRSVVRKVAFPDSGAFLGRARLTYGEPRAVTGGADLDLTAEDPKVGVTTKVTFHWRGSPLRIIDVDFDGDSLVQVYRNQFARIVDKDGPEELLRRLAEKDKAADEGRVKGKQVD